VFSDRNTYPPYSGNAGCAVCKACCDAVLQQSTFLSNEAGMAIAESGPQFAVQSSETTGKA